MNIEDSIEILKNSKNLYLKEKIDSDILEEAIETLLTAYEKEKEHNNKLLEALDTVNHEKGVFIESYEKEKGDNKRLRKCHLQYEEMTGIDLLLPEKEE